MVIHGFQKLTLLDYPGKVACTLFSGGCNFRCPFCQNGNLVQHPEWEPVIPEEEIFAVLEKRRGVLDGVCVTGGEPTLDPDLERFVTKIKELGYLVKLDTNGYRPEILKKLVEEKKIDYVAMDIKNAPSRYGETAGVKKIDVMRINESVEFLKSGVVDYEFRTTLCKELHGREEIEAIGKWLKEFLTPSNIFNTIMGGLGTEFNALIHSVGKAIKNAPRPNNIGAGIYAKKIASELSGLRKFGDVGSAIINCASYIGAAIDVVSGIINNVKTNESFQVIVSDAIVDATISAGSMLLVRPVRLWGQKLVRLLALALVVS